MKQRGIALITVMMVVAFVAILAVHMSQRLQRQVAVHSFHQSWQQSLWYALGAEQLGKNLLLQLHRQKQETVNLSQPWAAESEPFPVPGGTISGRLRDLQACFNLNALRQDDKGATQAVRAHFVRLILALEIENVDEYTAEAMAASLIDWLDNDSMLQPDGAEDGEYGSLPVAHLTANHFMASALELRALYHYPPAVVKKLLPYVCILPQSALLQLNVNTISVEQPELLMSLIPGLDRATATDLLQNRPEQGFASLEEFWQQPALTAIGRKGRHQAEGALGVSSRWFAGRVEVNYDNRRLVLNSIYALQDKGVAVVSRRLGEDL